MRTSALPRSRRKALLPLRLHPQASPRRRARSQRALLNPHHRPPARSHRAHNRIASQALPLPRRHGAARRRSHPTLPRQYHGRREHGLEPRQQGAERGSPQARGGAEEEVAHRLVDELGDPEEGDL
jgi:hypothetical protein